VPVDHNPAILTAQSPAALVTTATSQPALRTGFAMLGLVFAAGPAESRPGRPGAGVGRRRSGGVVPRSGQPSLSVSLQAISLASSSPPTAPATAESRAA